MTRARGIAAAIATLAAAGSAGGAQAATVSAERTCTTYSWEVWCTSKVTYTATAGERNDLSVHYAHACAWLPGGGGCRVRERVLSFTDAAGITAGPGCTSSGRAAATCVTGDRQEVTVALGDGDDAAAVTSGETTVTSDDSLLSLRVSVDGGTGDDGLATNARGSLAGGDGNDSIVVNFVSGTNFVTGGYRVIWVDAGAGDDRVDARTQSGYGVGASLGDGEDVFWGSYGADHVSSSGDGRRDVVECGGAVASAVFEEAGDRAFTGPEDVVSPDCAPQEPPPAPPQEPPPAADSEPPTISTTSPSAGATGVPTAATVSVTFSEPMDRASAEGAFSLAKASGATVRGAFSWTNDTMTFTPASPLAKRTKYDASVGTGARDSAGNRLATAHAWSFTTR